MSKIETRSIGKRLFHLINGVTIFGEVELIETEHRGTEIIIKKPYTARSGNIMPYMADILMNAPGAIQIHPMNVLWSVELNEFKQVNDAYLKATSILDLSATNL